MTAVSAPRVVSRDTLPVALIDPDPDQPRRFLEPAALAELAGSMKANGLAVPVQVRPVAGSRYRLVHGERRWRAATSLGWTELPAEIVEVDDETARWWQLVENVNRSDLSPIEEAQAYQDRLHTGLTQQALADRIGKTRTYVAQKLRLLDLPAPLALLLDRGALTEGHVRQLLRLKAFYRDSHTTAWAEMDPGSVRAMWADLPVGSGGRDAMTFQTLRAVRPLDWPPGYPFDGKGKPLVSDAAEAMWLEAAGATSPRWAQTAFYYGALTVDLALSVATLADLITRWAEHVHAAVGYLLLHPDPPSGPGPAVEWWGYRSDLRHAGLHEDNGHLHEAAIAQLEVESWLLPSIGQPGSPEQARYLELTGWSA